MPARDVQLTVESAALFGKRRYADAELSRITVSDVGDIRLDAWTSLS